VSTTHVDIINAMTMQIVGQIFPHQNDSMMPEHFLKRLHLCLRKTHMTWTAFTALPAASGNRPYPGGRAGNACIVLKANILSWGINTCARHTCPLAKSSSSKALK